MNWQNTIARWRKLPPQDKARRRWETVPERVARSMAFEGEPVNLQTLRETHDRSEPNASLKPRTAS
jgi:hypothetical protein